MSTKIHTTVIRPYSKIVIKSHTAPQPKLVLPKAAEFLRDHDTEAFGVLQVGDREVSGDLFSLTREMLSAMGINPILYKPGCKIILMDEVDFRHCASKHNSDGAEALYPLILAGRKNELPLVLNKEEAFLTNKTRIIALSKESPLVTLVHEAMHDVYFGGCLRLGRRNDFINEMLKLYRDTINPRRTHDKQLHNFFQEAARRCRDPKVLERIGPNYFENQPLFDPEFQALAAECFAYAYEQVIDPERALIKNVPPIILQKMETLEIITTTKRHLAVVVA